MSGGAGGWVERFGVGWLVISTVAYSTYVVLARLAISAGVNTLTAMVLHFSLACLIWWIVLAVMRRRVWTGVRSAAQAVALGVVAYAGGSFAFYQGVERASAPVAALTFAVIPLVVAVLAWVFLKERLGSLGRVALLLAVIGGAILTSGGRTQVTRQGMLWLATACLLLALYYVFSGPVSRALSPSTTTGYVLLGSMIFFWAWGGASGGLDFSFGVNGWWAVAALAVVPTVIGLATFMVGVGLVGATRTSIVTSMEPVLAIALGVVILSEWPNLMQIVGGVLVIAASVVVQIDIARQGDGPELETGRVE